eukprot:5012312-Prymnesium_polylepis.1
MGHRPSCVPVVSMNFRISGWLEVVTWSTNHAQGTLGDVWVTLWDPHTTFLMLHGEPESMFF